MQGPVISKTPMNNAELDAYAAAPGVDIADDTPDGLALAANVAWECNAQFKLGPFMRILLWVIRQGRTLVNAANGWVQLNATGKIPEVLYTRAPYTLAYATPIAPDAANGQLQRCTMTGNATLSPPTHPTDGMRWEGWFVASGGARDLSLDGAILIPTGSTFTSPKTLAAGKLYIVLLKYNGTAWMLCSIVGGY